jgi:hypothetical protein
MDDPRMLKPRTNDDRSAPPGAGSTAAWLARYGMVALLAVEESNATRDESTARGIPGHAGARACGCESRL